MYIQTWDISVLYLVTDDHLLKSLIHGIENSNKMWLVHINVTETMRSFLSHWYASWINIILIAR
jgi:hypothetical protein